MINNPDELARAVNRGDNSIEITGDLGKKIVRIKATGTAATIVAIGAVAVAMYATISAPAAGPAIPVHALIDGGAASLAVGVWGIPATIAAVSMAISVRSTDVLKKLRDGYDVEKKGDKYVLTKR